MDQVIFMLQTGRNRHEHICESLELFAETVMPRFVEGREQLEAAKAERLAEAIELALARRDRPGRSGPVRRRRAGRALPGPAPAPAATTAPDRSRARARRARRGRARAVGAPRAVRRRNAATPSSSGASAPPSFSARCSSGWRARSIPTRRPGSRAGRVRAHAPGDGGEPTRWTIEVVDGHAGARPGGALDATLTFRLRLADFVRIAAGTLDPGTAAREPGLAGGRLRPRGSGAGDVRCTVAVLKPTRRPAPR